MTIHGVVQSLCGFDLTEIELVYGGNRDSESNHWRQPPRWAVPAGAPQAQNLSLHIFSLPAE
jgi:hypothetical protein